jgi:hypothetical protein
MSENLEQEKQHAEPTPGGSSRLTPEEEEIISALEKLSGRKLTQQEIKLSLDQARSIGAF